jgi:hypothetical protein
MSSQSSSSACAEQHSTVEISHIVSSNTARDSAVQINGPKVFNLNL